MGSIPGSGRFPEKEMATHCSILAWEIPQTEDEMIVWHHQLDGPKSVQAPGVVNEKRSLAYCSPWGYKVFDMTEHLNWTELIKLLDI